MSDKERGLKYKRVLLKLSGEALMGNQGFGIDPEMINNIAVRYTRRGCARYHS